jgi:hypothetical protein
MKKSGLRNRFPEWVHKVWELDWHSCMVCHLNNWNALHHIVSPSSRHYIDGSHNESILNSCPIHNYRHPSCDVLKSQGYSGQGIDCDCHINNEAWLNKNISTLLMQTKQALEDIGYQLKPIDHEFIKVYKKLYE